MISLPAQLMFETVKFEELKNLKFVIDIFLVTQNIKSIMFHCSDRILV